MQYSVDAVTGRFVGEKPTFTHTQISDFTALLKHADGSPLDLTGCRAQCALKQNFIHGPGQELIAYALGTITAPETGAIDFSVECRSELFYNAVKNGTATCYFEISLIPSGETDSIRVSLDTVTLKPRVQFDEGEPQQAGPEYYTAAQVESRMDEREFAPAGGEVGDVLTKTATGQEWATPQGGGVSSVNGQTGDVTLDASDVGAISTGGMVIETLTSSVIPAPGKVYKFAPSSAVELTFPTPISGQTTAFKLRITMPDPSVAVTFPSNLAWKFATPTLAAGTTSELSFVWNGTSWEGWAVPDMSEYLRYYLALNYPTSNSDLISWKVGGYDCVRVYSGPSIGTYVYLGNTSEGFIDLSGKAINLRYTGYIGLNDHRQNQKGGFCISDATTGNLTIPGDLTFTPTNEAQTTLSALISQIEALEQAQN